jgi:CheY-like chemotaxis protein
MKKRILIIDNDEALNKINEKVLKAAGIVSELHIVKNGLEAISYLNARESRGYPLPEIIVLDLYLPVMNGFQFLDEFQKSDLPGKAQIEIVIFTSSSNPKDKQKIMSMGIRHYLNKPYILRGLTDVIYNLRTNAVNIYSNQNSIGKLKGMV